ncbi:unnamed protein product [Acanthosepion pharaonis]|uniref:Uncharacterized protein n=1 Tax=Acanthosepion pharaonis TaxID=158019 RepID=A0A812CTE1_ACAPH|nr:unnamed protein product [Sepia pharaonis]
MGHLYRRPSTLQKRQYRHGYTATFIPLPTAIPHTEAGHNTLGQKLCQYPHTDGYSGYSLFILLPTAITHFVARPLPTAVSVPLWYLIPMGIVATLYPLPTAATHFATEAVSVPHTDGRPYLHTTMGGGYSLSVTDGLLCDRSCVGTSYRWGIVATLYPVTDSRQHTLRQKLCRYLATDGYSGYFYPLPTTITHFCDRSCRYLIPMAITHFMTEATVPPPMGGCVITHFVPHTDGYSGYSFPLPTAITHFATEAVSVLIPMGIVATLIQKLPVLPIPSTAITHFATEAVCQYLHTDGYSGGHNFIPLVPMGIVAIKRFATEAVSVPHTDGYSGYSFIPLSTVTFDSRQPTLYPVTDRTEAVSVPSYRWV